MERKPSFKFRLLHLRITLAVLLCAAGGWMAMFSFAAEPSSGVLSEATPELTYTAGPFLQSNPLPVPVLQSNPTCGPANPCDSYTLTISNPPAYAAANPGASARFTMSWTDTGSGNSDYDFYIYKGEVDDVGSGDVPYARGPGQGNPEVAAIFPLEPGDNIYTVKIVPYTASGETVNMKIELLAGSGGIQGFPGFGNPDPTVAGNPRYHTYYPPKGSSAEASQGEMNIGFNPNTGRFMLNNIGPVWRVTPPEVATPGAPECCEGLWEERNSIVADTGVDPILWTDQPTGRTFVSNFTGGPNGLYAYTDSDGEPTATQPTGYVVVGAGLPTGGADHQTIGSGPYPASLALLSNPVNKGRAVYYCTQGLVGPGFCQRSDDLGQSYGPGTLAYTGDNCSGLHGHIRVGPDGTAYLPVPDCGGKAGVSVSTNGGVTWKEFFLPNSRPEGAGSDSSIAIDANNRLYYFYVVESEDKKRGTMHVQVGDRVFDNAGNLVDIVWSKDTDLGASHGVVHAAFPEAIAGDDGRAAVGFIGSDIEGDFQSINYPGYWYAFMSTTYDGGNTWVTVNVSPNDPVQGKGGVWQQGGSQVNRNLLDFNEITIDDKGRPVYGFDDGCVGDCVADPDKNSFVAHMRMVRQSGGRTLFASQDAFNDGPNAPRAPKAACLSGTRFPDVANLRWRAPDNGGADIVRYQIFRGTSPGGGTLIGETVDAVPRFDDYNADPAVEHYYYTVKAINSQGVGVASNELDLTVTPRPAVESLCILPGLTKLTDASGDSIGGPGTDLKSFQIGQPFEEGGELKIAFTLNTDPGVPVQPAGSFWYVAMRVISGQDTTYKGVRMVFNGATPTFQSYTPEAGSSGNVDGRFVEAGSEKEADPSSSYAAPYDKVIIVVKASDLGYEAGTTIAGFISGVAQSAEVAAALYDQMPNSLNFEGTYTVANAGACSAVGSPAELVNISTRLRVQRDDNVLFGGFIINGTQPERVIVRGIGGSLSINGAPVEGRLNDPVLELYDNSGNQITSNDNWKDSPERADIEASGLAPSNDLEPAIVRTLNPGLYTAIVRGKDNTEGIGLVEIYNLDPLSDAQLANISSRGLVETGDNVMIGGFITGVRTGDTNVVVRGIGPSIKNQVANAMTDPVLTLNNANGDVIVENDNWKDTQQTDLEATGLQPTEDAEAAIVTSLSPGNYTAVLRGKNDTTGVALVEIYKLQ